MKLSKNTFILLILTCLATSNVSATLIGDTIDWRWENCCGNTVFFESALVIEGSSELFKDFGAFNVTSDVEESSIHVTIEGSGFSGLTIINFWEDLDWLNQPGGYITNATGAGNTSGVKSGSGILNFGDDWVSFQTFISVETSGFVYDYWIDIETSHPIPEPRTPALFLVAFSGWVLLRHGKKRFRRIQ